MRNKIMRSEFFYNISGDMLEITPMPGGHSLAVEPGAKVFYYYSSKEINHLLTSQT